MSEDGLPRSRSDAKILGAPHYFTGLCCKNGHIDKRYTRNGACVECELERNRRFRADFPEKTSEYAKVARERDPEKSKARQRERYAENPERGRAYQSKYRVNNKEKYLGRARIYFLEKRKEPKFRLERSISRGLSATINGKNGKRCFEILGYTKEELFTHLEGLFKEGMTWENYGGDGWEVDHKIPLSAFNYETPDDLDFKRCWTLQNLQPLWRSENRAKKDRLSSPFQPSLLLSFANDNNQPPLEETA